jgi:hypothetical protein
MALTLSCRAPSSSAAAEQLDRLNSWRHAPTGACASEYPRPRGTIAAHK